MKPRIIKNPVSTHELDVWMCYGLHGYLGYGDTPAQAYADYQSVLFNAVTVTTFDIKRARAWSKAAREAMLGYMRPQ